jgi:hypothetical protein
VVSYIRVGVADISMKITTIISCFITGKLERGTRLAEFCSHALLALDVLTHPRALSLERADPLVHEAVQAVPTHNKSDVNNMVDAATEETHKLKTVDNPTSSNAVPNPIYSRPPGTQIPAVAPVDLQLINIARSACDSGVGYERSTLTAGETSISDFRLASLKALLASFLSSPYDRPPYLAQGIELFRRGKISRVYNIVYRCRYFCFL